MKPAIALAAIVSIATVGLTQPVSLFYPDLFKEAQRLHGLQGAAPVKSDNMLGRRARLNLRSLSSDSDLYYVDGRDAVVFACSKKSPFFNGGAVEAVITQHTFGPDGLSVFGLDICTPVQ